MTKLKDGVNIDASKQNRMWQRIHGSLESMGCLPKNLENYIYDQRVIIDGHDADLLVIHFEDETAKNSSFNYVIDMNSEGRLRNVLWADATSSTTKKQVSCHILLATLFQNVA